MSVQAVDERLNRGLVEMSQIAGTLAGLLAHHQKLGVDKSECINYDFALDRLDGIDNNGDGARVKLLERLLRIDINRGQPTAEARMRMVPADDGLGARYGELAYD